MWILLSLVVTAGVEVFPPCKEVILDDGIILLNQWGMCLPLCYLYLFIQDQRIRPYKCWGFFCFIFFSLVLVFFKKALK